MSLTRLLAEETQLCPTSLLSSSADPNLLPACLDWQTTQATKYNCSHDDYLSTFTPGQYSGVVAHYLSFNTDGSTPHFRHRAELFQECTGGIINFAEATDIAEDPIKDIGSIGSTGAELYDAYLMIYSFTSEASSLGLLETLNDRIRASNTLLKYEDIFPKVRSMGEYRKDGKTNIDLLMADGDFFVPIVRIDLLERDGKPLPHTWEDLVELAKFYNGTDLNDDGNDDGVGLCIYPRTGSGFNDAWIPELMYSTWATTDQTRGIQQGFFFDEETFEPRIGNGFENAMDIWKDLWANSADGCTTSNFVEGRCAIGFAPPGCWKGVFVNSDEGGIARRDENGTAIWRPTMKDGSYAEPYRLKPFGSLKVVHRDTDQFEECAPDTCPKGERIPSPSGLDPDDRARILVESPHVDKLINRVPFYWSGGYGTGIRKSADPIKKDLMWDFFVYVNTPITSIDDVVLPSWLDAWRYSQLASYERNFQPGGWSFDAWNEHQKTMHWALGNDVNSALTLRLPGVLTYTRDVVLPKFSQYMESTISMEDMKASVRQGWIDATTSQGKLNQVQIYRASLGQDPLSEFDLCRVHRAEMDNKDNTVCVKYDPQDSDSSNSTILIAVLVPVFVIVLAGTFIWIYLERKRRLSDAIWKINKEELKFEEPVEIAGRGTFGLVVKAEYRGTTVAVKRVIPPKDRANRASFLEEDNPNTVESGEMKNSLNYGDKQTRKNSMGQLKDSLTYSGNGHTRQSRKDSMDHIFDEEKSNMNSAGADANNHDLEAGHPVMRKASMEHSILGSVDTRVARKASMEHSILGSVDTRFVRKTSMEHNILSSVDTGVTVLSSGGNHHSSGSRNNSKAKWKRWFGYKSTAKNYEQLKQDFIVEMRILSKLRHPCITTVMGSVIDLKDEPMLVMEYMDNGSLYDLLHNDTIVIDGELIFPILQDISSGARFLHAADPKVIHGDLKAANVLVDSRFRAKIADFGLSAKKKYLGASGTPYWMAPELLRRESSNTAASDVYSFGIILYELYSRKDPYEGENPSTVLNEIVDKHIIKRPSVPAGCPTKIIEIMKECVDASPEKRPTFEEIDLRIKRLDSENVEPGEVMMGHQIQKKRAERNEDLLHQVFPKHIAKALLHGRKVEPDRVDMATMFFSDIVGFTTISSEITPDQVSDLLDRLYLKFDALSHKHDVFKIETIGDAYVGVCNLVKKQEADHAKRIAEFAIDTVKAAADTPILPDDPAMGTVRIRVGIHCGPLVARVVGSRNPRYCVFGDTVNTTARMESNSLSMRIQCSDSAAEVLKVQAPGMELESRGMIPIKGKGEMATFFIQTDGYITAKPLPTATMATATY
eukprot:CAMPEP_0172315400 /NCGR_PEP_ID=MMETSP1058-20130122/25061_1 /TAXON_ID=83371 /ORGANISM="Detonula confervacea, Strain CCMP 353" /LENGTH=1336 /DNA_ID=CAMNT_0013029473 /DNA_START=176 /DNA_END=4186 /DNA_ORIENTATION=+